MLLFNRYEYNPQTDLIGKGGFSRVYKAFDNKFKRFLALKIYKTSEFSERYGPIAEIHRVIELDHPNITRYMDIDEIEKENSFGQQETIQVCVMELLEGGNLAKFYNIHKDLYVFKKLIIDVLYGLSYLHKNGIIHRDIKPANILIKNTVDGPIAKITDFGISKRSDASTDSSISALIVSIPYMAPEQLNAQKYGIEEKIHYNIDLWSLGVAVFEIITGEILFKNTDQDSSEQIMANIIATEIPEKIKLLPKPFNDFVSQCVIKDAKYRIKTAEDLLPFLQEQKDDKHSQRVHWNKEEPQSNFVFTKAHDETDLNVYNEGNQAGNIKTSGEDSRLNAETILLEKQGNEKQPLQLNDQIDQLNFDEPRVYKTLPEHIVGKDNQTQEKYDKTNELDAGKTEEIQAYDETVVYEANKVKNLPVLDYEKEEHLVQEKKLIAEESGREMPAQNSKEDRFNEISHINVPPKNNNEDPILVSSLQKEKELGKVSLFNRYDYVPLTDLIGKGGFSRVYKAFDKKLSRWVALKIYKTGEFSDRYSPIAEIKRVINLDHSNICRYLDIEEIEKENTFGENEKIQVCVMELLDSGNFADFYHKSDKNPDVLKKLLQDVLNGISYLHKNGIIHRDIKPANILIKKTIEGPVAKITDFGISKLSDSINNNTSSALIVSIPYMAPEQLNPRKYGINEKISFNLDLWSLGVTIFEVMTGKVLFKNTDQDSSEQIMANIMAPELPEKINELPQPFRNIVSYCIVKSANDRAQKAEELLVLLNSTFNDIELKAILSSENPDISTSIQNTMNASGSVGAEPSVIDIKGNEPTGTNSLTDNADNNSKWKKFTVVESTPELAKKAEKNINYLKISIGVAAVLFLAVLLFYLFADRENKKLLNDSTNTDTIGKQSSTPASTTVPPALETTVKNTPVNTQTTEGSTISGVNDEKNVAVKKDKSEPITNKNLELKDKNGKQVIKKGENSSVRYLLILTSNEDCTVKMNSGYSDEIKAANPFRIYLKSGNYIIEATSLRTSKTIIKNVEVTPEEGGGIGSIKLMF